MQKQHPMQQYHDLLAQIMSTGIRRPNRTGDDTYFIPGAMLRFDMADGFPAITTKKLAFKTMLGELLGFFRGYTSAADFRSIGCKVWDGNANETKTWLANPVRKGEDDLGRIYSSQWTDWRDWRESNSPQEEERFKASGYELIARDPSGKSVWRKGINQIEESLRLILQDPCSRRNIISGWRPDEHDQCALPVCHVSYQWLCDPTSNTLHLVLYQRSYDSFLAFNIPLGAVFLEIMARLSGMKAGTFTHFIADSHIYLSHMEQVKTLLSREHYAQPTLKISDRIKKVSVDDIPGVFASINPEDFELIGYQSHPTIKANMAA